MKGSRPSTRQGLPMLGPMSSCFQAVAAIWVNWSPGMRRRANKCGGLRSRSQPGAACWQRRGGVFSTAPLSGGIKEPQPAWSGVLATAGDVIFYGTLDGWFKAVHAKTGEVLWKFKVGSGIIAAPMTFLGPTDGNQYVAVYSGVGGWV